MLQLPQPPSEVGGGGQSQSVIQQRKDVDGLMDFQISIHPPPLSIWYHIKTLPCLGCLSVHLHICTEYNIYPRRRRLLSWMMTTRDRLGREKQTSTGVQGDACQRDRQERVAWHQKGGDDTLINTVNLLIHILSINFRNYSKWWNRVSIAATTPRPTSLFYRYLWYYLPLSFLLSKTRTYQPPLSQLGVTFSLIAPIMSPHGNPIHSMSSPYNAVNPWPPKTTSKTYPATHFWRVQRLFNLYHPPLTGGVEDEHNIIANWNGWSTKHRPTVK